MRSTHKWLALAILGLAIVLVLAVTAQAQGNGVLEGQVVNGTAGAPQVGAGITVTLHVLQGDVEVNSLQTTTNAGGHFRFDELDTDAELEYWPEAFYLDVSYNAVEPYQFVADQTALQATVTVYETTGDDSAIKLDSVHMIAESFGQVLRISEIHLYGNTGDRTYVGRVGEGDQVTTVLIPLPQGAVGVAFQEGMPAERFVELEDSLLDTEPVPPGDETSLVFFSYHLVVDGETVPLERRFAYPLVSLNLLAAQPGLALRSEQLQAMGPQLFQDRQYEFYAVQGLAVGTSLEIELLPQPGVTGDQGSPSAPAGDDQVLAGLPTRGNQGLLRWFGFGFAGLALIAVGVYSLLARGPVAAPQASDTLTANPRARRLLAELAGLEAALEAGQVDEAAYERQRAELYDLLKAL
jgi:hypothetical protein